MVQLCFGPISAAFHQVLGYFGDLFVMIVVMMMHLCIFEHFKTQDILVNSEVNDEVKGKKQ